MNKNRFNVKEVLDDFEVDSEIELEKELLGDNWDKIICLNCKKKYSLITCHYTVGGISICPHCYNLG